MHDWRAQLELGLVAVRSSIRLGGWLVRGTDGYAEVRFDVDEIVQLVPIDDAEAERFLDERAAAGDAHVLVLGERKRLELATKGGLQRHGEVLGPWHVGVRWGSTSEHQGGRSFRAATELETMIEACSGRATHVRVYSRNPEHAHEHAHDRLSAILAAVNDRTGTVQLEVGGHTGALVAAPATFAGQPYGLATFAGDRIVRLYLPFGSVLIDALRGLLVEQEIAPTMSSAAVRAELRKVGSVDAYAELLATHRVTVHADTAAPVVIEDPADAPRLATLVTSAFVATLELAPK